MVQIIKNPFGLNSHGELIHISEINTEKRGLLCELKCPSCHGLLIANLGEKKKKYFSHAYERECSGESLKHALAKLIIKNSKRDKLLLPDIFTLNGQFRYYFYKNNIKAPNVPDYINLIDVQLEKTVVKGIITDCLIHDKVELCIEIRNTHKKSMDDIRIFNQEKLYAVEIDVRKLDLNQSLESIYHFVLIDAPRYWISNPIHSEKLQDMNGISYKNIKPR